MFIYEDCVSVSRFRFPSFSLIVCYPTATTRVHADIYVMMSVVSAGAQELTDFVYKNINQILVE